MNNNSLNFNQDPRRPLQGSRAEASLLGSNNNGENSGQQLQQEQQQQGLLQSIAPLTNAGTRANAPLPASAVAQDSSQFTLNLVHAADMSRFQQQVPLQLGAPAPATQAVMMPQLAQQIQQIQLPQQQIPQNPANNLLLMSLMDQKAQISNYETQLRQRFITNQSEPLLQPPLLSDPRLLVGQNMLQVDQLGLVHNRPPIVLPSPHELSLRDDNRRMRGGVIEPFPEKLHRLLTEVEAAGRADVISFIANGKAFAIHKPDKFFREIVPKYFRQSRLSSFKRQLNLYGFELINTGPARGGYFHEMFVKDTPELCRRMRRIAVKLHAKQANQQHQPQKEQPQPQQHLVLAGTQQPTYAKDPNQNAQMLNLENQGATVEDAELVLSNQPPPA